MVFLKTGYYYVSINRKKLLYITEGFKEDYSNLVLDFELFRNLVNNPDDDIISLSADVDFISPCFLSLCNGHLAYANNVLDFSNDIKIIEDEEFKMNAIWDESTPMEKLDLLEKTKIELEDQIKKEEQYNKMKKASDDMFVCRQAIIDSGFTKEEAMQLMLSVISGMSNQNSFFSLFKY